MVCKLCLAKKPLYFFNNSCRTKIRSTVWKTVLGFALCRLFLQQWAFLLRSDRLRVRNLQRTFLGNCKVNVVQVPVNFVRSMQMCQVYETVGFSSWQSCFETHLQKIVNILLRATFSRPQEPIEYQQGGIILGHLGTHKFCEKKIFGTGLKTKNGGLSGWADRAGSRMDGDIRPGIIYGKL